MGASYIQDRDETGRVIVRTAATVKGWHYSALFFKVKTSTDEINCKDYSGNDLSGQFHIKRIDSQGSETTTKADAVKTIITWKPDYDYEIISGALRQKTKASQEVLLHVTGGVYNEATDHSPISVKPFVQSMDLSFFEEVKTDGRASKYMQHTTEGVPFGTNRFQYTLEHAAGFEHELLITLELFKS